jgi:L-aspartate oxidase
VNGSGWRFMPAADPRAELAPRDVVARAVHREIAEGRGAFLDCRALPMETAFPTAYEVCREVALDPAREPIPIAPAAHYHMGGVLTDAHGRTSLTGLWACGEAACTGVHGANRLASNSLLEAVVFAARVAADVAAEEPHWRALGEETVAADETVELPEEEAAKTASMVERLRETMALYVGVERSEASLLAALAALKELDAEAKGPKLRGMIEAALLITAGAYARKESRGAHRRLDYPEAKEPARHTYLTLAEARKVMEAATGGQQERGAGVRDLRQAV